MVIVGKHQYTLEQFLSAIVLNTHQKMVQKKRSTAPFDKSIFVMNPEILKEWDYEKNILDPKSVYPSSNKKAFWKCAKGLSWEAVISSRIHGCGCPNVLEVQK